MNEAAAVMTATVPDTGRQGSDETQAQSNGRRADILRRRDATVARMRAEGREPASTDGLVHCGAAPMSFSLRWPAEAPDEVELRLSAANFFAWGAAWPHPGARIPVAALLATLTENWTRIGRPYLSEGVPDPLSPGYGAAMIDLSAAIGVRGLPHFHLLVGGDMGVVTANDAVSLGSETLIAVEVLKSLGDLLDQRLTALVKAPKTVAAWRKVRDLVDVFPAQVLDGDEHLVGHDAEAECAFYARRAGVGAEVWRRAALWLSARAALGDATPATQPTALPEGMPLAAEVATLSAKAAKARGLTLPAFEVAALRERNLALRAALFYARWPEIRRWPPAPVKPDAANRTDAVSLTAA